MELGMCLANAATEADDLKRRGNPQADHWFKKKKKKTKK